MAAFSIQPIDLIIIGAYLILMLVIGVVCVNRIKNTGDYYVAGRSFGPIVLMATAVFMIYTATSGLFGVVYTDVLQFYMLIIFVYILIPSASLIEVGGLSNFFANLAPEPTIAVCCKLKYKILLSCKIVL